MTAVKETERNLLREHLDADKARKAEKQQIADAEAERARKARERVDKASKYSLAAAHVIDNHHRSLGLRTGKPLPEPSDEIRELMKLPFDELMKNTRV